MGISSQANNAELESILYHLSIETERLRTTEMPAWGGLEAEPDS